MNLSPIPNQMVERFPEGRLDTLRLSDPRANGFYDPHDHGRSIAERALGAYAELVDAFRQRDNQPQNDLDPRSGFVRLNNITLDHYNMLETSQPVGGYMTPDSIAVTSPQPNGFCAGLWAHSRDGEVQEITCKHLGFQAPYTHYYKLNPDGTCTVMDDIPPIVGS